MAINSTITKPTTVNTNSADIDIATNITATNTTTTLGAIIATQIASKIKLKQTPHNRPYGIQLAGFTLIEMLVALAIGASIAAISYRALEGAIRADEQVFAVTKQVDDVDRVFQYLANDLLFAVPRTWVDQGGEQRSALIGVFGDRLSQSDALIFSEDDYLLRFARSSRDNVLGHQRSSLFMAGYRLTVEEGSDLKILWRDSWSPVDGSDEPKIQQRQLLDGIKSIGFRYLNSTFTSLSEEAWVTGWPSENAGVTDSLPAAVEVTLELSTLGKITRLFNLSVTD